MTQKEPGLRYNQVLQSDLIMMAHREYKKFITWGFYTIYEISVSLLKLYTEYNQVFNYFQI